MQLTHGAGSRQQPRPAPRQLLQQAPRPPLPCCAVLGGLHPQVAIISTPNFELNSHMREAGVGGLQGGDGHSALVVSGAQGFLSLRASLLALQRGPPLVE